MDLGCSRYSYQRVITLFIATSISFPSFASSLIESFSQLSFIFIGVMALAALIVLLFFFLLIKELNPETPAIDWKICVL